MMRKLQRGTHTLTDHLKGVGFSVCRHAFEESIYVGSGWLNYDRHGVDPKLSIV